MTNRPRTPLGPAFADALEYATEAHAGQLRKGTDKPYVDHPIDVASYVVHDGGTEEEAIAALLHDTVEDQGGRARLDDIERRFGTRVAQIVAACSEWIQEPDQTAADKPAWLERKRTVIERIRTTTDESVLRVALADKLHNAGAIVEDLREDGRGMLERFSEPDKVLWYYRELVEAFRGKGSAAMQHRFEATVGEMERLIG